jgi:hypothetical protein
MVLLFHLDPEVIFHMNDVTLNSSIVSTIMKQIVVYKRRDVGSALQHGKMT